MKTRIVVYESHEKALEAVTRLKNAGFPLDKVSLIGEAQIVNDHMYLKSLEPLKNIPLAVGAVAGIVSGLLTGMGVFSIPGFGFLYGAGAIVGAIGGFDFGIISGGLATILIQLGVKKNEVIKYKEHIKEGKFLLKLNASDKEIAKADFVLNIKQTQQALKAV